MRRLLVLAALCFALPAHAATFYVDSEIDAVDALLGDGVCATSTGACTLRAAIQEANYLWYEDTIEVPAGNYVLTIEGIDEDAAATGDLDITGDLILTGAGRDETAIDAAGLDRVFHVLPYNSPSVELSGVTVTGGEANYGAGISVDYYGTLSIFDSAVADNWGAGISGDSYTDLSVFDSAVAENGGSGIVVFFEADLLLSGSIVEGNTEGRGVSGGMADITIEESTIRGNFDGGVGGYECWTDIRNSVIDDNGGTGVGLGESPVLIDRTTISNNGAGGVSLGLAHAQISNSTIAGNQSDSGAGGIQLYHWSSAAIDNTTISGNTGFEGGGIAVGNEDDPDGVYSINSVSLSNSTIVDNSAQVAGGLAGLGYIANVNIKNSILANNSAAVGGPDCFIDNFDEPPIEVSISSGGHNILGDASDCDFTSSTGDRIGTAESPIDPKIGPLADNGGPTKTHALLSGSPAVDAIPVADCTYDDDGNSGTPEVPLTEDQRGVLRPQGEACDIGAYEAMSCNDGIDNDRDGTIDWNGGPRGEPADPGCADADDLSERSPLLPCDDGADNDGDGRTDFDPLTFLIPGDATTFPSGSGDPGCYSPSWYTESPQCQDGSDNYGDGKIDYDGGLSALGYVAAEPDPYCVGRPWQNRETASCGLGAELALLLPPLMWMWRRRRA